MQGISHTITTGIAARLLALAALTTGVSGCCAAFLDQVTSRDFHVKDLFTHEDPMDVVRSSPDAAKRGRALASLREPLQNKGTQAEQELYMKLLTDAAIRDPEPLCRLGAIRALGNYKDTRALRALEDAYLQKLPFTAELNSRIRQESLASLQATGNPEARHLLIRVARAPSESDEESFKDRQQSVDERLCAIRGLAKYEQYDSVEALLHVLETEKSDVALRRRAHESLQQVTGKNLPPDADAWREFVQNKKAPEEANAIQRVMFWNKKK